MNANSFKADRKKDAAYCEKRATRQAIPDRMNTAQSEERDPPSHRARSHMVRIEQYLASLAFGAWRAPT